MKKFLIITTAILVLLFVSFGGYIQYQRNASYQTRIPANTRMLIRIDVVGIGKSVAWEYLWRKEGKKESTFRGLSLPANLFVFTLQDKQPTTFFSVIPISDPDAFRQSIKNREQIRKSKHEILPGIDLIRDGHFTLGYNNKYAVLVYSQGKEEVQQAVMDILQDKNTIPVANSSFRNIKEQEGHITFLSGGHYGSLDFNKGNILMQASLFARGISAPAQINHPAPDTADVLSLWLYADGVPLLANKIFNIDTFCISGDSLLASKPKGLSFRIMQPQLQKDTVITYEYNDDFEKVATTSVAEKMIPGIVLEVEAEGTTLYQYLVRQRILHKDSGTVNRQAFPLYQAYATSTATKFLLSTARHPEAAAPATSNNFFGLYIDFVRLHQQPEFATLNRFIAPFERMEASAVRDGAKRCTLKARLIFKNKKQNALFLLLDNF